VVIRKAVFDRNVTILDRNGFGQAVFEVEKNPISLLEATRTRETQSAASLPAAPAPPSGQAAEKRSR
jgi:hypothetical protein